MVIMKFVVLSRVTCHVNLTMFVTSTFLTREYAKRNERFISDGG